MAARKPRAPSTLGRDEAKLWRQVAADLVAQGTWRPGDGPLVTRYVLALHLAEQMRDEIADRRRREAAGEMELVDGELEQLRALYSRGSTGQLVAHPAVRILRDAEADSHKYAEALLLTPASRARAGLHKPAGESKPRGIDALLDDD